MKKAVGFLLPLALVFFVCAKAENAGSLNNDDPVAPNFTIKDLEGNSLSLSDFEGKVVFLNFWATWCGPCKAEIPGFVEVYEKYKGKGMQIIGISLDRLSEEKIRDFAKEYKINYPVAKDSIDLASEYQAGRIVPETFIIDKTGKIKHRHIGYMEKEVLEKYFLDLAGEK